MVACILKRGKPGHYLSKGNLVFLVYHMAKVIKVSDRTYEKLAKNGTWSDTMDAIIERLINQTSVGENGGKLVD